MYCTRGVICYIIVTELAHGKMDILVEKVSDVAVIRRILFAAAFLPHDYPYYWKIIASFAFRASKVSKPLDPDEVKVLIENIQVLQSAAFIQEKNFVEELILSDDAAMQPIGVILISSKQHALSVGENF